MFDLMAVFEQKHIDISIELRHLLLLPHKVRFKRLDYETVFAPDFKDGPNIFDARGVDRTEGALVVVRPDQNIANVLPLHGYRALTDFFGRLMVPN